jgi:hypothetical protein
MYKKVKFGVFYIPLRQKGGEGLRKSHISQGAVSPQIMAF